MKCVALQKLVEMCKLKETEIAPFDIATYPLGKVIHSLNNLGQGQVFKNSY